MTQDKKDFIETILTWFRSPQVGNDEEIDRAFLSDAYDSIAYPQWISVEDELPEYDQRVLWCWDDGLISIGRVALDEQHIEAGYITHWMPLPSVEHLRETTKMIEEGGDNG